MRQLCVLGVWLAMSHVVGLTDVVVYHRTVLSSWQAEEKQLVKQVYENAIDRSSLPLCSSRCFSPQLNLPLTLCPKRRPPLHILISLSDADQSLPQLKTALPLLLRSTSSSFSYTCFCTERTAPEGLKHSNASHIFLLHPPEASGCTTAGSCPSLKRCVKSRAVPRAHCWLADPTSTTPTKR